MTPGAQKYLLVALTDEGEELRRITVTEDRLAEAKSVLMGFADWIDVFRVVPGGVLVRVAGDTK